ncbi:MAG: hypothetical protein Q4B17_11240 [Lautropia sp.]|nr:hypothetical protein [Lautropia sp.]
MNARSKWAFIALASTAIFGCNNHEHPHTDAHVHETKSYDLRPYFKPCPGGLHQNGRMIPKDNKIYSRKVFLPKEIKGKNGENQNTFYYAVILPDWSDEKGTAIVACSSNLEEVAAWACEKDSSFDGIPCKVEILHGGKEKIGDQCVQTEMFISGYISQCQF